MQAEGAAGGELVILSVSPISAIKRSWSSCVVRILVEKSKSNNIGIHLDGKIMFGQLGILNLVFPGFEIP